MEQEIENHEVKDLHSYESENGSKRFYSDAFSLCKQTSNIWQRTVHLGKNKLPDTWKNIDPINSSFIVAPQLNDKKSH